jgi:uncharacterized protein YjbI with pentapeptide repeats
MVAGYDCNQHRMGIRRTLVTRTRPYGQGPAAADPLPHINELIAVAKAGWLGLLAYLAFVGVTLIGVEDADFFIAERRTQLPLIGVTIPTSLFFAIAPGLGAILYTYLHLYLLKLWEALAEAPATWNKAPIGDSIRPWMIADYALSFRKEASVRDQPLRRMANAVSGLLVFWAGPGVLAYFWWRSMPKHDEALTVIFCGIPFCVSLYVGLTSWLQLKRLVGGDRVTLIWRWLGWRRSGLLAFVFAFMGWLMTEGTLGDYARRLGFEPGTLDATPFPWLLRSAQLQGVVFVQTPPDWQVFEEARHAFRLKACQAEGLTPTVCGKFYASEADKPDPATLRPDWCAANFPKAIGGNADTCNTYFKDLDRLFLTQWTAERKAQLAALPDRDLAWLDLRGANLSGALLDGATLTGARLTGADLSGARLEGADLRGARLEDANLSGARLEGADLSAAWFEELLRAVATSEGTYRSRLTSAVTDFLKERSGGQTLTAARLDGANLSRTQMEAAKLAGARLTGTTLFETRLEGAYLIGAELNEATLFRTRLAGASLVQADLNRAFILAPVIDKATDWTDANLEGVGISSVDLSETSLVADLLETAFGDGSVILPNLAPRPAHWPDWRLPPTGKQSFDSEWQKWLEKPSVYLPPPPPQD